MRKVLPEIGFAFVFDHGGIPLLWDVLMQTEVTEMTDIEILRWLARENQAFRDHILDFCSQYAHVQEQETTLKAESIRFQIFGKCKRSDTDASEDRTEKHVRVDSGTASDGAISGRLELDAQANETGSEADSDCGKIVYSSSESDTEDPEPSLDFAVDVLPSNQAQPSE